MIHTVTLLAALLPVFAVLCVTTFCTAQAKWETSV
jgi:hypothetical protein